MNHILPLLLQNSISYIKKNRDDPLVKSFLIEILDDILKDERSLFQLVKQEILKKKTDIDKI